MSGLIKTLFVVLLSMVFLSSNASAHDNEDHYDRIHLKASATAQLENDTMVAILYAEEEGSQANKIASVVNRKLKDSLDYVKTMPGIKHQTNSYTTTPVYNKKKIIGWRVRQSIRLESKDMALMGDVLGRLQRELALQSINFTVSPQRKQQQDNILIDEALQAFEDRARQVVKKLGRRDYRIVDINISTSGANNNRQHYRMAAMAMESADSVPPAISAGEQTVTVTVNGSIELE